MVVEACLFSTQLIQPKNKHGLRPLGIMEGWNSGMMALADLDQIPNIPLFQHSNIPTFHKQGAN